MEDGAKHPKETRRRKYPRRLLEATARYSPSMTIINQLAAILAVVLTVVTLAVVGNVLGAYAQANASSDAYQSCQRAAIELQETSDYLTSQARMYVSTGQSVYLENYVNELQITDRRGKSLEVLQAQATNEDAIESLELASKKSNELALIELYALRLTADATKAAYLPSPIADLTIGELDAELSDDRKRERANELVFGDDYTTMKLDIRDAVQSCSNLLFTTLKQHVDDTNARLATLLAVLHVSVILLLIVVLAVVFSNSFLLLMPISLHEESIRHGERLVPRGARELRYLTDTYNEMFDETTNRAETLNFEAHNDALTGMLNRAAFNDLLVQYRHNSALILVDVDLFKHFNDDYGHDMGDAVLIEVSATLYASFRSTDFICRIGGDEFAVIMVNVGSNLRDVIAHKIDKVAAFLRDTSNGLPSVTISVGVAFGEPGITEDGLFHKADAALYESKRSGRNGYTFYHELPESAQ